MSFDFPRMAREGFEAWKRDRPDILAFDTETSGLAFHDEPFCVTAAWRSDDGIEAHYFELAVPEVSRMLDKMLRESYTLVGHNLKFDLQKTILANLVYREDLSPPRCRDTAMVAHLLDEHRSKKLKQLAVSELGIIEDTVTTYYKKGPREGEVKAVVPKEEHEVSEAKLVVKKEHGLRSVEDVGYHLLPREVVVPYAIKDAEFTLRLWEKLSPQLARDTRLWALFEQEMELSLVALDMETAGWAVDVPYAEKIKRDYGRRILFTENEIRRIVGKPIGKKKNVEFNPNSGDQIIAWLAARDVFIEDTQKDTLRAVDHPLAERILELKALTKMHGTYLVPLTRETRDGIIHPNFRPFTKTGRMAAGGAEQ